MTLENYSPDDTIPDTIKSRVHKTDAQVAEEQFHNYATHLAIALKSQLKLVMHSEWVKARNTLINKVGKQEAERVMDDFFVGNAPIFSKHTPTRNEHR